MANPLGEGTQPNIRACFTDNSAICRPRHKPGLGDPSRAAGDSKTSTKFIASMLSSTAMPEAKHAIVFGASGIGGWAIVNALCNNYPSKGIFSAITALTNRPLPTEISQWPKDARLTVASGIDLMKGSQEELEHRLKNQIDNVSTVTQLFFFSYQFINDREEESRTNRLMLQRAVKAMEKLSPDLEHVVLPSGTKAYGVHLLHDFPFSDHLPLRESHPRIPEPHASEMFYYHQIDELARLSEGKAWTWTEVRPDNIIGFVPNNNAYCIAQTLAVYLSLYAFVEGKGSNVPFPGTAKSWTHLTNDSSQDIVGKFSIYASLHGHQTGGRTFNVADSQVPTSWSQKWPVICEYFGLQGTGPVSNAPQPGAYTEKHRSHWDRLAAEKGLRQGIIANDVSNPGFQHFTMTLCDFDRQLSLDESRRVGFLDETNIKGAYWTAFDRFRAAKIIP